MRECPGHPCEDAADLHPHAGIGETFYCDGSCRRDPHTRSWSEMRAEGIEIETMSEYRNEVRGFNDLDAPEPPDPYDEGF